jgi:DHA1 family inner membrane transport protein
MKKERILLFTLALIQFSNILDFMIMMPLGQQLMRVMHIDSQHFGFLVAAYTLSAFASGIAGSFWIDRYDRKTVLLILYSGFVLGTFACALSRDYYLLLASRVFTGAFGGLMGAAVYSIVGDVVPPERRGRAMGIVMTSFSIASVFGVPFAVYMAALYDWHAPFILVACFGLVVLLIIAVTIPSMRDHLADRTETKVSLDGFRAVFSNPNQRRGLLFIFVLLMGHFLIIPFLSPYMVANVGFSEKQLALIYLVGGSFTFFSSPRIGKLADQKGKHRVFYICLLLSLIPVFLITHMQPVALPVALAVTSMLFVFVNGRMVPANALLISAVDPKHRGRFMSLNSATMHLATALGSIVGGMIVYKDVNGKFQNYDTVGYIALGMCLFSIYLISRITTVDSASAGKKSEVEESATLN